MPGRAARYDLHLALLTVEETGSAEYSDSYDWRGRRGRHVEDEFEAGEVEDRVVTLSDWQRPDGGATPFGTMSVAEEEISPADAFASLDPGEQHFTEATGNEGRASSAPIAAPRWCCGRRRGAGRFRP